MRITMLVVIEGQDKPDCGLGGLGGCKLGA